MTTLQGDGGFGRNINAIFGTDVYRGMGGRPLASVTLNEARDAITFAFQEGEPVVLGVEGDCCSSSWIEHLTVPDDIVGQELTDVQDGDGVPWDGHECVPKEPDEGGYAYGNKCDHEHLQVYNTRFRTAKGDIVLEYRNDSNGYYGGYLVRR